MRCSPWDLGMYDGQAIPFSFLFFFFFFFWSGGCYCLWILFFQIRESGTAGDEGRNDYYHYELHYSIAGVIGEYLVGGLSSARVVVLDFISLGSNRYRNWGRDCLCLAALLRFMGLWDIDLLILIWFVYLAICEVSLGSWVHVKLWRRVLKRDLKFRIVFQYLDGHVRRRNTEYGVMELWFRNGTTLRQYIEEGRVLIRQSSCAVGGVKLVRIPRT